jgi:hypothetical protein
MVRKVFFSFHYDNDVWRANVVRNSWVTKPDTASAGFMDAADFEELKKKGEATVKRWIDDQMNGTSVTVVLIGSETIERPFVRYEIEKSFERGNGILGIYIDQIGDSKGNKSARGSIYGLELGKNSDSTTVYFSTYPVYEWVSQNGYANLGEWVEEAARRAGR